MKTRIIVITGGVYSSLGKGIVASSVGRILKEFGFKISIQKLDPYLNIDPGTLSPYQHGEVFVTKDGAETDLDLGHYERFIDYELNKYSSVTAGKIYDEVLKNERSGKYHGKTVQVVSHVTNCIQEKIKNIIKLDKPDFLIIEVGGTIGDIESLPFIEALRSFSNTYSRKRMLFIHCAPLIKINVNQEIKTKPTQHSIKALMNLGIIPNLLILRSEEIATTEIKKKIAMTSDIDEKNIFTSVDCNSIYDIPKILYDQKIHKSIFSYFNIKIKGNIDSWNNFLDTIKSPKKYESKIAIVGKYVDLSDSYLSVIESLKIASYKLGIDLNIKLIDSTKIENNNYQKILKEFDGILIPGGFGERGLDGKILSAKYARENNVPFFGICLGMQAALIEFARNVLSFKDANSIEFDKKTKHPVFKLIDKKTANEIGGTLRLGNYEVNIIKNSLAYKIYKSNNVLERHRHRYFFNTDLCDIYSKKGVIFSGTSNNKQIVEIIEIEKHPFFIGVQYHPEFMSRPLKPSPLFESFLNSTKNKK